MIRLSLATLLLAGTALLSTGCGSVGTAPQQSIAAAGISGKLYGGQQPIIGATITVWQAGTSGYGTGATQLASTMTDSIGNFSFATNAYTCAFSNAPVYVTAQGGDPGIGTANPNIMQAAALGSCGAAHSAYVVINEVSTAATAFALGQFFTTTLGGNPTTDTFGAPAPGSGTYNAGLIAADTTTVQSVVNYNTGNVADNTTTKTIEAAKIYSIANTLAACVNTTGQTGTSDSTTLCGKLFTYTTTPSGARPSDTLQAAVQMSLYPYQNVSQLYTLPGSSTPFTGLSSAPTDWTIGVAYTSASLGLGISGASTIRTSSTLDIDANGKVWFPTNTATAHGVAYFDPASGTFNGPYSTGLTQPQYVAIDMSGNVWATDLASNQLTGNSTTSPTAAGSTITLAAASTGGPLAIDLDNAVLFSYLRGGSPYTLGVESGGSITATYNVFSYKPTGLVNERVAFGPSGSGDYARHVYAVTEQGGGGLCALEEASAPSSGNASDRAENSGDAACLTGGGAASTAGYDFLFSITSANKLFEAFSTETFTPTVPLNAPEGIATDGKGNEWIANSGNGSVSTLAYVGYPSGAGDATDYVTTSPVAYLHGTSHGATMTAPFGIGVDASGNVWVSNASCITTGATACTPSGFTLTELIGAGAPTITPVSAQGIQVGTEPQAVSGPAQLQAQSRRGKLLAR